MAKENKKLYLSKKYWDFIEEYKVKNGFDYRSQAVEHLIDSYKKNNDITTDYIIDLVAKRVLEEINPSFRRILSSLNSSDKNSKIILEMLNGKFIKEDTGIIFSIDEKKSPALEKAERIVSEKIVSQRISKLDRNY